MFNRILIIQTAFIGDVILTTPLIEKLNRFYPESTIDILVKKGHEKLLDNNPKINRVISFDKNNKKYVNLIHLIKDVRKQKYDLAINVQRHLTTGIITAFSGANTTVGYAKNPLSFLFDKTVEHNIHSDPSKSEHEVIRNLKLIEEFTDNSFEKPKLYPSADDLKKTQPSKPYYCIAPTSVLFTKEYPVVKWIELIQKLPSDSSIYLLGAPGDKVRCDGIVKESGVSNITNLAGELSFLESAALMKGANMNFVNDSAPLHIASSVNAPVRAIFCSTTPALGFTPLSDDSMVIETKRDLPCRPCGITGKRECPEDHFLCSDIAVDDILKTIGVK